MERRTHFRPAVVRHLGTVAAVVGIVLAPFTTAGAARVPAVRLAAAARAPGVADPAGAPRDGHAGPAGAAFTLMNANGDGSPTRWDPCTVHPYVVSTANAPAGWVDLVAEAFARLTAATGLRFRFAGVVADVPEPEWTNTPDPRWPRAWRPIVVAVAHPSETGYDLAGTGGRGGVGWVRDGDATVYVSGAAVLNADETYGPGFTEGYSWGAVLLHELGHVAGLGHGTRPTEIMSSPRPHVGPAAYSGGELAGLRLLGSGGCLAAPAP